MPPCTCSQLERGDRGEPGRRRRRREFVKRCIRCPTGEIGVRLGEFDCHGHIGQLVLDRLIAAKGAPEHRALHHIVAAHLQAGFRTADGLEGRLDCGSIEQSG
jgi:hypothetical protein